MQTIAELLELLPEALRQVPGFVQVGFLRASFCAWNTRARYGDHTCPCKWCGLVGNGHLSHYLSCSVMLNMLQEVSPLLFETWVGFPHPPFVPMLTPECLGFMVPAGKLTATIIGHAVLHTLYSAAKHYTVHSFKNAIKARLCVITRHSAAMHKCIDSHFVLAALAEPAALDNAPGH